VPSLRSRKYPTPHQTATDPTSCQLASRYGPALRYDSPTLSALRVSGASSGICSQWKKRPSLARARCGPQASWLRRIVASRICGDSYTPIERTYGSFSRSFTLPTTIDLEHITAATKDGVLRVNLPNKPETKPRTIKVQGASSVGLPNANAAKE
jgi:hypothetical protein